MSGEREEYKKGGKQGRNKERNQEASKQANDQREVGKKNGVRKAENGEMEMINCL